MIGKCVHCGGSRPGSCKCVSPFDANEVLDDMILQQERDDFLEHLADGFQRVGDSMLAFGDSMFDWLPKSRLSGLSEKTHMICDNESEAAAISHKDMLDAIVGTQVLVNDRVPRDEVWIVNRRNYYMHERLRFHNFMIDDESDSE